MDPAYGYKVLELDELNNMSTGYIIYITPSSNVVNYKENNIIKDQLKNNIKIYKKYIFIIVILNIIFIILYLIESSFLNIITHKPYIKIIIICINFVILNYVLNYINNNLTKLVKNKITNNIMLDFYKHVFRLPLKYIHIKDREEINKRILDLENIIDITIEILITFSLNISIILTIIVITLCINKIIFLILLIYAILNIIISYIYSKNIMDKINNCILSENSYKTKLNNYIMSIISIKHNNVEDNFINNLNSLFIDYNKDNYNLNKSINKMLMIRNIFISILNIIIISYYALFKQDYFVFFIIYFLINILNNTLNNITNQFSNIIYRNKNIYKVNDFYALDTENNDDNVLFKKGIIEIKDLSFNYQDLNILNNINITINLGEKIILKGESGCGKSTLCKILIRYFDNYDGNISINNINIRNISIKSLRDNIIYSGQNESIIQGTIRENILLGQKISKEKLNKIIEITSLKRIIDKKPFGLDTYLFGAGNELSGGEKQLIFLARALIKDANIIILDETLSMVNEKLENKIIKKLFSYYKDTTIIYVTHKNQKNYFSRTLYM